MSPGTIPPPSPQSEALKKATARLHLINATWEMTQATLAVSLTAAAIFVSVTGRAETELLKNALFVVLGFYFGRTNHTRPVTDVRSDGSLDPAVGTQPDG